MQDIILKQLGNTGKIALHNTLGKNNISNPTAGYDKKLLFSIYIKFGANLNLNLCILKKYNILH